MSQRLVVCPLKMGSFWALGFAWCTARGLGHYFMLCYVHTQMVPTTFRSMLLAKREICQDGFTV